MHFAAPVECFYSVSVTNSSRLGIRGIHLQEAHFFERLYPRQIRESRVQEVVRLARQQFQRKGLRLVGVTRLFRRNKRRDRVEPESDETLVVKQRFAAWSAEIAVGKGQERLLGL